MKKNIGIAAVGDATKVSSFSGTPYHFLEAAQRANWNALGWELDLTKVNKYRYLWNLLQLLQFQKKGGYQYSVDFSNRLLKQIPTNYLQQTVISFNQFFPPAPEIVRRGGKAFYYIDSTFSQLIDRYEVGKIIGENIKEEALKREKGFFEAAEHIVTFQNWAKQSVINDYGISENKVSVILPGANFNLPENYKPVTKLNDGVGKETPLILGFIGKDWKRKGLDVVIEAASILIKQNYKVEVHCIGFAPDELTNIPFAKFLGFIDKQNEPQKFVEFISHCHIGCLFSKAEFSSISVFEFLRIGTPVAGYVVDGMGDLYFPEASMRFAPIENAEAVANVFAKFIDNSSFRANLQTGASEKSMFVSWDRSVEQWNNILSK